MAPPSRRPIRVENLGGRWGEEGRRRSALQRLGFFFFFEREDPERQDSEIRS